MNRYAALGAAALLSIGCADRGAFDVSARRTVDPSTAGLGTNAGLTVMTWNVYYGTDPKIVLQAQSLDQIPVFAAQAWALLQGTNFPERAGALARAIAANGPDLVGVQEAAVWRTQHPSDFFAGNFAPNATTEVYDFLALLTDSLAARGLHYVVAAADTTTDIEVPMVTGIDPATGDPTFDDIRLTDRDAVLVREGITYSDAAGGPYAAAIPIDLGLGSPIFIREGWSSVVATVRGQSYRFVSTHLEILDLPGVGDYIQYLQAGELVTSVLRDETLPTIVVGDFNSEAGSDDPSLRRSYDLITGTGDAEGGFTDVWVQPFRSAPGLTCCQSDDLSNPLPTYSKRVDFIFTRNLPQASPPGTRVLSRKVLGDEPGDRTASGLWPSDHGGVVATLIVPPLGVAGR